MNSTRHPLQPTTATTFAGLAAALVLTLTTLIGIDHLATEQHAGTVMARAAAAQQVQASAPAGQRS